jgi:hypothetical protein
MNLSGIICRRDIGTLAGTGQSAGNHNGNHFFICLHSLFKGISKGIGRCLAGGGEIFASLQFLIKCCRA